MVSRYMKMLAADRLARVHSKYIYHESIKLGVLKAAKCKYVGGFLLRNFENTNYHKSSWSAREVFFTLLKM